MSEDQTPEVVEAAAPEVVATPTVFAKPRKATLPSLPDYIAAAREGGSRWLQLNDQIKAATGDVVVSDAAGLVPTPVVTPYYDDIQPLRPIVSALGVRGMPTAGSTFLRPKVANHSGVAVQASELGTLETQDFDLTNVTFTKKTYGGKLVLSEQVIDWSTPSMLQASVQDLAGQYALATEGYVVDQMAAAITNSQEVIVTDFTDSEEVIGDLYTAAASIAATGNYFPNALVMAPTMWAKLGSVVDLQGRPLFPQTAPSNGIGLLPSGVTQAAGNPLGLTLVVSNQIGTQEVGNKDANEYWWMLNTRGVEFYEDYKGFVQVVGTNLGVTVLVRGYVACEVLDVNMIRILGPDATFS
jgi:HK97 family phage major capsid protein